MRLAAVQTIPGSGLATAAQFEGGSQRAIGESFDGTGAFGPWFVTADGLPRGLSGLKSASTGVPVNPIAGEGHA